MSESASKLCNVEEDGDDVVHVTRLGLLGVVVHLSSRLWGWKSLEVIEINIVNKKSNIGTP